MPIQATGLWENFMTVVKFGRWYNMVWMEKRINTDQKVLPVKWFGEYREELERLLEQQREEQE